MQPILATVLLDTYEQRDAPDMFRAIDEICRPGGIDGFASTGIYAFWNPQTVDLLYIGLARDLAIRFAQHNDLIPCEPSCCKARQIEAYFNTHDVLGYSMLVMSSNDQPSVARNKAVRQTDSDEFQAIGADLGLAVAQAIASMEGFLIRSHARLRGMRPIWNKNSGAKHARELAEQGTGSILSALVGDLSNPHVARTSIRELAVAGEPCLFEEFVLHPARIMAPLLGFQAAIRFTLQGNPFAEELWAEIERSRYLEREPIRR